MTTSYPPGSNFASDFPEDADRSNANSFDIRDHLDKLLPGKGKNKYVCPVCEGRNLSVAPKTGKYKCWSGDCLSAHIREAIRPLAEFLAERKGERPPRQTRKPKAKKKQHPPVPIPLSAKLLRLPAPGKSPRAERPEYIPPGVPHNAAQITYSYSSTQKVLRFEWPDPTQPKGRDKTYRQFYIDPNGNKIWKKGDVRWQAYFINEIVELLKSIPDGEPIIILIVEGEPNVELARLHGIAALTLQGSSWSHPEIQMMLETLRATGKNVSVAMLRDNDDTGLKKGEDVWLVARHIQFPCIIIDPRVIYSDIPKKGDIQEILEAIGLDEFLSRLNSEIASQVTSIEPHDTSETTPLSFEFERETKYRQTLRLWKKARAYTPTVQSNSKFVEFPDPAPNTITCIKAKLGRGKTQWLAWLTTIAILGKFLLLGHRNALLRGTCKRIGAYHIRIDNGQIMLSDPNGRIASCVDSLMRFRDDCAEENTTIVLDEVESLKAHILTGGTISPSGRPEILRKFAHLLNTCSRIILLDGHLTDETVAWIASLAPGKAITKYENTFRAALPQVTIYRGGAPLKPWQVEAFKNLVLKSERPAVFCDSKDDAIAFYKQLEEKHGEGKGLLLTADNVGEDLQGEFMDSPDESICKHQWAFIVASPLLQDGVNISTPDYFSEVFGMFGGVVSVNSVCQMVRRVRHPVRGIKILCAERGYHVSDGDELDGMAFLKTYLKRVVNELREHEEGDIEEIAKRQWRAIADDPHHLAWAKLKTFLNLERPHLYDFVCELLNESGHQVTELDIEKVETAEHKTAKEEGKRERAEAVAAAKIISIAEADKIQKGHSAKREDILAVERAVLVERLPGVPITPELVLRVKKERNLISGMQNLWYFQNPDKAKQLRRFKYEEGKMLVFASDHKTTSLVLQALKNLNIGQFLEPGKVWDSDSPEVLAVAEWGKSKKAKLIDKEIGQQEDPIHYLQSLLGFLGVKLVGKQKKGQKREYSYLADGGSLPADFSELYAAVSSKMFERYEEKVQKQDAKKRSAITSETLDSTELDTVSGLANISL
jgi:Origin of replication binding protein